MSIAQLVDIHYIELIDETRNRKRIKDNIKSRIDKIKFQLSPSEYTNHVNLIPVHAFAYEVKLNMSIERKKAKRDSIRPSHPCLFDLVFHNLLS